MNVAKIKQKQPLPDASIILGLLLFYFKRSLEIIAFA